MGRPITHFCWECRHAYLLSSKTVAPKFPWPGLSAPGLLGYVCAFRGAEYFHLRIPAFKWPRPDTRTPLPFLYEVWHTGIQNGIFLLFLCLLQRSDDDDRSSDRKDGALEEQIERLQEKVESAQSEQKNLFLVIFQVSWLGTLIG